MRSEISKKYPVRNFQFPSISLSPFLSLSLLRSPIFARQLQCQSTLLFPRKIYPIAFRNDQIIPLWQWCPSDISNVCVCVFVYFRTIRDIRKTSTVLSKCVPQCSHHMKNWIYYLFGDIERTASLVLLFFFLSPANHSKLYVRFE